MKHIRRQLAVVALSIGILFTATACESKNGDGADDLIEMLLALILLGFLDQNEDDPCKIANSSSVHLALYSGNYSAYAADLSEHVVGEVLVRFAGDETPAEMMHVADQLGMELVALRGGEDGEERRYTTAGGIATLRHHPGNNPQRLIDQLQFHPDVELVEPNYIYRKATVPNDPYSPTCTSESPVKCQWGHYSEANNQGANTSAVWNDQTSCAGQIVAVLDTGIDYNHEDLRVNMWGGGSGGSCGYNFVMGNNRPMDFEGHGSHVAGIIGAKGNNSIGVAGACWDVQLMAVKVLDDCGSGTSRDIADGILYANSNSAKIINMSLGGGGISSVMFDALDQVAHADRILIAAAGNENSDNADTPVSPANHPDVISIASHDYSNAISSFSNYGNSHGDGNSGNSWSGMVHIAAPGGHIYSTLPNNRYGALSGTSMAAPFAAGIAALALENGQTITNVRTRLGFFDGSAPPGCDLTNGAKNLKYNWRANAPGVRTGTADC